MGPAGVGKTSLLRAWAWRHLGQFERDRWSDIRPAHLRAHAPDPTGRTALADDYERYLASNLVTWLVTWMDSADAAKYCPRAYATSTAVRFAAFTRWPAGRLTRELSPKSLAALVESLLDRPPWPAGHGPFGGLSRRPRCLGEFALMAAEWNQAFAGHVREAVARAVDVWSDLRVRRDTELTVRPRRRVRAAGRVRTTSTAAAARAPEGDAVERHAHGPGDPRSERSAVVPSVRGPPVGSRSSLGSALPTRSGENSLLHRELLGYIRVAPHEGTTRRAVTRRSPSAAGVPGSDGTCSTPPTSSARATSRIARFWPGCSPPSTKVGPTGSSSLVHIAWRIPSSAYKRWCATPPNTGGC
jgi:hypothetical protein